MNETKVKVGGVFKTNNFGDCTVLSYKNSKDIIVRFLETGSEVKTTAGSLRKGMVKDPNFKSVAGVGFIGCGRYKPSNGGLEAKGYKVWVSMLRRCYNKKDKSYHSYGGDGVTVCSSWFNYQNYIKWYIDNYREGYHIDKDILSREDKVYSPETCRFVPQSLNNLILKPTSSTHTGVSYSKGMKKYESYVWKYNKKTTLGYFDTPEEAFQAYEKAKEAHIRFVAEEEYCSGNIPEVIYKNLLNYEVVDTLRGGL